MLYYILPIVISFFSAIQYDLNPSRNKGREFIWYTLLIYLISIMGFRFMVGADTLNYMIIFKDAPNLENYEFLNPYISYEPLFLLLWAISKSIYPDFYVFQIIHAIILNVAIFSFIKKYTSYRFTALCITLFLYYFYFSTEVLREAIAVFIFAFSYKYIEEKKFFRYYLSVIMACLFHLSAIVLIFVPFFSKLRLNYIYLFVLLLLCLLLSQSYGLFDILSFFERVGDKAGGYKDTPIYFGWLIQNFARLTVYPILILAIQKFIFRDKTSFESLVCIYTLIGFSIFFFQILYRLANYLLPFYSIFLANFFCSNLSMKVIAIRRSVVALLIILFVVVYGYYYIAGETYRIWVPYYSIFNPIEDSQRENFRP